MLHARNHIFAITLKRKENKNWINQSLRAYIIAEQFLTERFQFFNTERTILL